MDRPLSERRTLLHERIPEMPFLSRCDGVVGAGKALCREMVAAGHEGVVAKQLSSRYIPNRRGRTWLKIKEMAELPCVVIGYRSGPEGLRDLLMATLMDGALRYVGVVELGIPQTATALARLDAMRISRPAIPCSLSARWTRPELFCTVRFCGWRPNGVWRDALLARWDE
jgi:bifunctional non-homologous end joining protein LigD